MTTTIYSNGSKWAGQAPDSVDDLLRVLRTHDLNTELFPVMIRTNRSTGTTRFFGNFRAVSHVFNIDSDDPDVVRCLTNAIAANRHRQARRALHAHDA